MSWFLSCKGYQSNLKVLYSGQTMTPGSVTKNRYISSTPERVLDAPELCNDFCECALNPRDPSGPVFALLWRTPFLILIVVLFCKWFFLFVPPRSESAWLEQSEFACCGSTQQCLSVGCHSRRHHPPHDFRTWGRLYLLTVLDQRRQLLGCWHQLLQHSGWWCVWHFVSLGKQGVKGLFPKLFPPLSYQVWDIENNKCLRSMRGHSARVCSLSWNDYILSR